MDCSDVLDSLEKKDHCGLVIDLEGSPFEECFNMLLIETDDLAESCIHSVCDAMSNDAEDAHQVPCEKQ